MFISINIIFLINLIYDITILILFRLRFRTEKNFSHAGEYVFKFILKYLSTKIQFDWK